jgi:Replication initiator protein A
VHDRDIMLYCFSQLIAALNAGREISPVVRFCAHDFLKATNRVTSGEGYAGMKAALERLRGTQIKTNIETAGTETWELFGFIDYAKVVRSSREGRMEDVEVRISDFFYRSMGSFEVLTYERNYFRLRKPLERRLYELGRKHTGKQPLWKIGLAELQEKCGSASTEREFRRLIKAICVEDEEYSHMPDFSVRLLDSDIVEFRNRRKDLAAQRAAELVKSSAKARVVTVKDRTLDAVRQVAPGYDRQFLLGEWRYWMAEGGLDAPKDADKAFLGFCRKYFERHGHPG